MKPYRRAQSTYRPALGVIMQYAVQTGREWKENQHCSTTSLFKAHCHHPLVILKRVASHLRQQRWISPIYYSYLKRPPLAPQISHARPPTHSSFPTRNFLLPALPPACTSGSLFSCSLDAAMQLREKKK